jgi:lipopolysaccharide/colanic/teichoic acid biosynthesis glycosyltransferase
VVPHGWNDPDYMRWIGAYPFARVVPAADIADVIASYEQSDTLLIIDPQFLPLRAHEFSLLARHYADDPRVSHNLVSFEQAVAGTKERVAFDAAGHVRGILRHYDVATWPFIAAVAATMVPVASGILADGSIPTSLTDLRQTLVARGVPSRDLPMQNSALHLDDAAGFLAANEHFLRDIPDIAHPGPLGATPVYVGGGHAIHETVRITGPVVIHDAAQLDENVMVFGPAVIGAGARIAAGAVVAHAAVGPDATVPSGTVVRNSTWFDAPDDSNRLDSRPLSYSERLSRLLVEARSDETGLDDDPYRNLRGAHVPFKRAFDITAAALALIALSPVLIVIAAAIWLESRASIFYGDLREGFGGRDFRCWKFRTMYSGAHNAQKDLKSLDKMDGPHFKLDFDPRVTRVGRVLRALNLDELPQLFNVLVGEMSLVGPRPSPFRENQVCVPWREARLSVRPGITGFWQVCRHDRAAGDFHQWIEYDLLYVQNISFWLDLKILLATLLTLGGKAGYISSSRLVSSLSNDRQTSPIISTGPRSKRANEQVVPT